MSGKRNGALRLLLLAAVATVLIIWVPLARADGVTTTQSLTGTLAFSSSDVFQTTITLTSPGNIVCKPMDSEAARMQRERRLRQVDSIRFWEFLLGPMPTRRS